MGTVIWFAASTPPDGYLECNGQSTTSYPELATVVGAFVPDLRGKFIRGWDNGAGIDVGRTFLSTQIDAFQGHWHSAYYAEGAYPGEGTPSALGGQLGPLSLVRQAVTDGEHGIPRVASETRPINTVLLPCIKY